MGESTNDNVSVLKRAYNEWGRSRGKNVEEILDLFHDHVTMGSVLDPKLKMSIGGNRTSKGEAREYFNNLLNDWEMVDWKVDRFIADGDDVVVVGRCHWRSRHGGGEVDSPKVDIWHFEDGKVASFFEMFDTLQFAKAAGAL
jgi:ketosteroid isomerase-like protein